MATLPISKLIRSPANNDYVQTISHCHENVNVKLLYKKD